MLFRSGEVRVFHRNVFLCRAIDADHAANSVTLKDIQAARIAHRRRLRQEIREKQSSVIDYLPAILRTPAPIAKPARLPELAPVSAATPAPPPSRPKLRTYYEGD